MTAEARSLPHYTVRRSARARRPRVTMSDAGEAVVVLPARAPTRVAAELVVRHAAWIRRHREAALRRSHDLAARPALGAGRTLALDGTPHAVRVLPAADGRRRSTIAHDDATATITIHLAPGEQRAAAELLEGWLRRCARRWIAERVAELSPVVGVTPARITIRDGRTRWASASAKGTLSFSWRLVLCPRDVFDYVVVHELAHLQVRGHSRLFWALVDRHVADARAARRWLRDNHSALRHALD